MWKEYKTRMNADDFFNQANRIRNFERGTVGVIGQRNKKGVVNFCCLPPYGNNDIDQSYRFLRRKYSLSQNSKGNIKVTGKPGTIDLLFGFSQIGFIGVIIDIIYKNFADPDDLWFLIAAIGGFLTLSIIKLLFTIKCWKKINKIMINNLECEKARGHKA